MAEPITTATIGSIIVTALKEVGKWAYGYLKKTILTLWDNKYVIFVAGTSSGLFLYYYNMLYNWFTFAPILNMAVLGIFALLNLSWVISNWKQVPTDSNNNSGPSVQINN